MKDIKSYIKLEDSTETGDYILINQEDNSMSYAKEISLTDYMIGFADYRIKNTYHDKILIYSSSKLIEISITELLDIYFKEKGIII